VQNETNNDWVTIAFAIRSWRATPSYDALYRMVKRSGIETRRRGKYLTFRLADLRVYLDWQHDVRVLAHMVGGDWYTRSLAREQSAW